MHRAYSFIEITKDFDQTQRSFAGVATAPQPDRMQDVIESSGVTYAPSLPLLLYHDKIKPVGEARFGRHSAKGTPFQAVISTIDRPGIVKDRLQEAEDSLLAKPPLIRAVSIGFRPLVEPVYIKETGGYRFPKIEVLELSMVVVPAHQAATIDLVKSLDTDRPAASGTGLSASRSLPGASGRLQDRSMNQNVSEQITEQRAVLQTKTARLQELMTVDDTDGGLQPEEVTERDTLASEVKSLTSKIANLGALEAAMAAQATNVQMPPVTQARTATRIEFPKKEYPKGTLFTRYAMAVAAGKGSHSDTLAYAKRWTDTPEVVAYIKAVEGTSVVASPGWGGELVNPNTLATEFVELVRAQTILGRVPGFRMTPFNIPIITQTGGSTFEWVGEGGIKPVGELAFVRTTLGYNKVAGIVVLTDELIRLSTPSAEETVRRDLTEQCARFLDEQFIQTGVSAGANNPASVTQGVTTPGAASGADLASLMVDLNAALATFDTNDISTEGLVIVTTPSIARGISMLTNPLGQTPTGFNVTPTGGTLLGYPVIVSASVDSGVLVIMKPSEIFLADDGRVTLDASKEATLDMGTDSPTSPTFNLWQRNCVGIRAERWITWQKRRAGAVAVISAASYGPSVGSP